MHELDLATASIDNIYLSRYILSCHNRRDGDGVHECSASDVSNPAELRLG